MTKRKKIKKTKKPSFASTSAKASADKKATKGKEKLPAKDTFVEAEQEEKRNLRSLARDIIGSYDARLKIVGEIVEDTHRRMADFKGKREALSQELREVLAKCESLRRKDFNQMMADIITTQNEREKQVREMLENFRKEEEMMVEKLRNLLKGGEEIRLKDFKKMMSDIKQEQERRAKTTGESVAEEIQKMQAEVHTMLDNFKKERQSVAGAWHEMLDIFHNDRVSESNQKEYEEKTAKKIN